MLVYLSKKIAIPNQVKLCSLSWNSEESFLACGGEGGLLKVVRLDHISSQDPSGPRGVAAPTNLTMNQTLNGHTGSVTGVKWNGRYQKLTTSDSSGLIIVWVLQKGVWREEMVNKRSNSLVADMRWTADGQRICIVYDDGTALVGTVDGNRVWGKELDRKMKLVEWSPDGRKLLFVTVEGEILLADQMGRVVSSLPMYESVTNDGKPSPVVGIHWYDGVEGTPAPGAHPLAVAFESGLVALFANESQHREGGSVVIETGLEISQCHWNSNGSVLAIAGRTADSLATSGRQGEEDPTNAVQGTYVVLFYSPFGQLLASLKVPGGPISALTWEGGGLRLALAVDSFMYFANVRPDYKWGFVENSLVYSYIKPKREENCVVFFNSKREERYHTYIPSLIGIASHKDTCVIAHEESPDSFLEQENRYCLEIYNAIGSLVSSKTTSIRPHFLSLSEYHAVAASEDHVFVWQVKTGASKLSEVAPYSLSSPNAEANSMAGSEKLRELSMFRSREKVFHIDDRRIGAQDSQSHVSNHDGGKNTSTTTDDPIRCLCAGESSLLVGRQSGKVHRYSLPHISLEDVFQLSGEPEKLYLNCGGTRLAVVIKGGRLCLVDLEAVSDRNMTGSSEFELEFERKDVWDVLWSEDDPLLFAFMEKARLVICRDTEAEEALSSSGYLARFKDLQITAALLDEALHAPEHPTKTAVMNYESQLLRSFRKVKDEGGLNLALDFVQNQPHKQLWRLLGEAALQSLEFNMAERAYAEAKMFDKLQFVKRLRQMGDNKKQMAEILMHSGRYSEAERLYFEMDRGDLALNMRWKLGDLLRVVQLVQSGAAGDDKSMLEAWNKIGEFYADHHRWEKAIGFFQQTKNAEALVQCFSALSRFDDLLNIGRDQPDGSPLLLSIAERLESFGLAEGAAAMFAKAGEIPRALKVCEKLNAWDVAIQLANQFRLANVKDDVDAAATTLLKEEKTFIAIEIYRKAQQHHQAALLFAKLGREVGQLKSSPVLAKKLFVLAGLEMDKEKKKLLSSSSSSTGSSFASAFSSSSSSSSSSSALMSSQVSQTLDLLLSEDKSTAGSREGRDLDKAWRGAEAYHLYLLATKFLYQGFLDGSMKTALRLSDYEDYLPAEDIYCLIALTSFCNGYYKQCSNAFVKLETLPSIPDKHKKTFADLALNIFTQVEPQDPSPHTEMKRRGEVPECPECGERVAAWHSACPNTQCQRPFTWCTATARTLFGDELTVQCPTCKHPVIEQEVVMHGLCPLCQHRLN